MVTGSERCSGSETGFLSCTSRRDVDDDGDDNGDDGDDDIYLARAVASQEEREEEEAQEGQGEGKWRKEGAFRFRQSSK